MPSHIHPRHVTHLRPGGDAASTPLASHPSQWRCTQCRQLLGVIKDGGLHLRFSQVHEYFVSLPAKAICRGCGTLNRKAAPVLAEASQPDAA